jgi:hypothetical protein
MATRKNRGGNRLRRSRSATLRSKSGKSLKRESPLYKRPNHSSTPKRFRSARKYSPNSYYFHGPAKPPEMSSFEMYKRHLSNLKEDQGDVNERKGRKALVKQMKNKNLGTYLPPDNRGTMINQLKYMGIKNRQEQFQDEMDFAGAQEDSLTFGGKKRRNKRQTKSKK